MNWTQKLTFLAQQTESIYCQLNTVFPDKHNGPQSNPSIYKVVNLVLIITPWRSSNFPYIKEKKNDSLRLFTHQHLPTRLLHCFFVQNLLQILNLCKWFRIFRKTIFGQSLYNVMPRRGATFRHIWTCSYPKKNGVNATAHPTSDSVMFTAEKKLLIRANKIFEFEMNERRCYGSFRNEKDLYRVR